MKLLQGDEEQQKLRNAARCVCSEVEARLRDSLGNRNAGVACHARCQARRISCLHSEIQLLAEILPQPLNNPPVQHPPSGLNPAMARRQSGSCFLEKDGTDALPDNTRASFTSRCSPCSVEEAHPNSKAFGKTSAAIAPSTLRVPKSADTEDSSPRYCTLTATSLPSCSFALCTCRGCCQSGGTAIVEWLRIQALLNHGDARGFAKKTGKNTASRHVGGES